VDLKERSQDAGPGNHQEEGQEEEEKEEAEDHNAD